MALIVEDGSGKSDSESYISVTDADTRQAALGLTDWAGLSTAEKEQLLRQAADYMLQVYRSGWKGNRMLSTQALDFPRYGIVVDGFDIGNDVVPAEVANACADLALQANSGVLLVNQGQKVIKKKIAVLETTYEPSSSPVVRYSAIDGMLAPYLDGMGGNAMPMVRV